MDPIDEIMAIVEGYESQDKEAMIQDLLCLMQEDDLRKVLYKMKNHLPLIGD
jgi:hypothetical protein